MDDPFRSSHLVGTCPRCQSPIESDGEFRLVCARGCGEWYSRARLAELLQWDHVLAAPAGIGVDGQRARASAWPWGAAVCAMCPNEMKVGIREDVRFDYCANHGVWLDAGEISRFAQVFELS